MGNDMLNYTGEQKLDSSQETRNDEIYSAVSEPCKSFVENI